KPIASATFIQTILRKSMVVVLSCPFIRATGATVMVLRSAQGNRRWKPFATLDPASKDSLAPGKGRRNISRGRMPVKDPVLAATFALWSNDNRDVLGCREGAIVRHASQHVLTRRPKSGTSLPLVVRWNRGRPPTHCPRRIRAVTRVLPRA